MPSNIPGGYLIVNNEPIDSRFQHETTSSRDTLSIIRSYEGLITFIKQNKSLYVLTDTGSGDLSTTIGSSPNSVWKQIATTDMLGAAGSSVTYVSGSNPTINSIKINDNDPDVSVDFNDNTGRLTLSFGTPTNPPPPVNMGEPEITLNPYWNSNRFNNETQTYTVTGNFPTSVLNSYEYVVTASLFTGSVLLTTTSISSARNISTSLTTSGSQSYRLQLTASRESGLFTSEYIQSRSAFFFGTINKSQPDAPIHLSIRPTLNIQNNLSTGYFIEQHATGSLSFGYITSSNSNGWEYIPNSLTASINGGNPPTSIEYKNDIYGTFQNLIWTGSMTGSSDVTLRANAHYRSPGTLNIPQIFTRPVSSPYTYNKIKSIRYGMWPVTVNAITPSSLTVSQPDIITNLGLWSLPLTRSINFPTTTFSGNYTFAGFNGHAIIVCDENRSINTVKDASGVDVDTFSVQSRTYSNDNVVTYGGYKIYLSRLILTPLASGPLTLNIS